MSESETMRSRFAASVGSGSAARSQASSCAVCRRSARTALSVSGSRRLRARSMMAGPMTGRRATLAALWRIAALPVGEKELGQTQIVRTVDIERVFAAHLIAETAVGVEHAGADDLGSQDQHGRAVAGPEPLLFLSQVRLRGCGEVWRHPPILHPHERGRRELVRDRDDTDHRIGLARLEERDGLVDMLR